ncbi:hypothetical protein OSB04_023740 [Centaurea solstitialis]|uniref:F-box associated beta-propeller type 1 domain-containing protein n=1 Tax=Centaurea solstitialis TaxID=347529 RepID=A0AA38SKG5_9ASTR|nr:hypothetical protein OSB04_023740 [Centaurea solstitialis]
MSLKMSTQLPFDIQVLIIERLPIKSMLRFRCKENIQSISRIPFQVMVFTLSSGQWRCLSTNQLPRKSIQFYNGYQTVIGQFIYLVGFDWSAIDGKGRNLIMSFDLTTREFREVDVPNSLHHSYHMSVSRLRESLVLLDMDPYHKHVFHVWVMDGGDSKAFTKLFTINPPNADVWQTLGFSERGEPIIEWTNDEIDGSTSALGIYEHGSGDIKDLGIRGNHDSFYGSCYTESLLLLDHEDGRIIRLNGFQGLDLCFTTLLTTGGNMTKLNSVGYPIDSVCRNFDWVQIRSHNDYHTPLTNNFTAALCDPLNRVNTDYGINEWIIRGLAASQLVLGLAYGVGYSVSLFPNNYNWELQKAAGKYKDYQSISSLVVGNILGRDSACGDTLTHCGWRMRMEKKMIKEHTCGRRM